MTTSKLSVEQHRALGKLTNSWQPAYALKETRGTLDSLVGIGRAECALEPNGDLYRLPTNEVSDFGTDELSDLTRLKGLREAGYFESEGSVPMPEIVADGDREALQDLLSDRRVPVPGHHSRKHAHTNMFCTNCDQMTQHGQVATYENTGQPVFHCNFCCKCHLCRERPSGARRLYEAVNNIGDSLAAWEEQYAAETPDNPTFCSDCGAMLRCSVCRSTGPGGYCQGCGQKDCAIEGCDGS